jgi:CO/xanthine dehydrogenase Mo-binding subunit
MDGPGPGGAKGMGEGGIIPVAPAIANALAKILNVRIKKLPLSPDRIWRSSAAAPKSE